MTLDFTSITTFQEILLSHGHELFADLVTEMSFRMYAHIFANVYVNEC